MRQPTLETEVESFYVIGKRVLPAPAEWHELREYQLSVVPERDGNDLTHLVSVEKDVYAVAEVGKKINLPIYSLDGGRTWYFSKEDAEEFAPKRKF